VIFNDSQVITAFSRRPANMSLNYGLTQGAIDNRKYFLGCFGIDYRDLVCAKQTHSTNVRLAGKEDKGSGALSYSGAIPDTDAFITGEPNLPLAVFTADCLSVFLYDPANRAVGLVHAGWKGSRDEIVVKTVALMREKFNTKPLDLLAGFGPSIRQCCYEVGSEFRDYFTLGLQKKGGRYFLDLAGVNRKQLLDSGLREENISDHGRCTSCFNDEFFSFRKEAPDCGRMISVAMLK
jgi:polyphenol oxidase